MSSTSPRPSHRNDPPGFSGGSTPSITDPYQDLLALLAPKRRAGLVSRLASGFYEGWRPSRDEVADLVAVEVGVLTWEQAAHRAHQRSSGAAPPSITPDIRRAHRERMQHVGQGWHTKTAAAQEL